MGEFGDRREARAHTSEFWNDRQCLRYEQNQIGREETDLKKTNKSKLQDATHSSNMKLVNFALRDFPLLVTELWRYGRIPRQVQ